ncbi:cytochrome P450 [Bimuria novae-zelandiae CBS 107.79]|uniref:Cytochrome P450 n=1 Tax=Bimuria novae-zelandiae CBS 107.79 TaxID=1447943 RepID=A0A6A5VIC6_9PLEO|nr:cytochrome P450 [Bimuria novae-zelandiae CBS 107.79]
MAFFLLAVGLYIGYLCVAAIRSLFFHPLSNIPGPFLARMSTLPSFYHAYNGDRHLWIWQNFQAYGDKFRADPNTVLFNSPKAYADIHGTRANTTRGSFYRAWKRDEHDVTVMNSTDPARHAKLRKLLNLAFTDQSLKASSPVIAKHVDRWVYLLTSTNETENERLDKKDGDIGRWSSPVNMAVAVERLIFDILGELCYGASFDTKESGENPLKAVPDQIMKAVKFGFTLSRSPIFNVFLYLHPRGLSKVINYLRKKEAKQYNAFIETSVDKRIAAHKTNPSKEAKDMFHFLLTAIDPDTGRPAFEGRTRLLSESRVLVLAGTDTTASSICGLFFYLSRYPTVLARLTSEIRETFESSEEVAPGTKLSQCKYLRACIDETLRLAHPAPGDLPREVLPGGAVIDGAHCPAGTNVGCSAWSMGRNERLA